MFNLQKRPPRPCHLPQPCIGIPWRHRWVQEGTMWMQRGSSVGSRKFSLVTSRNLIWRACQMVYQKVILRQSLILVLRHPRRQKRTHPQSVMPPQWRNQCRHTLYR